MPLPGNFQYHNSHMPINSELRQNIRHAAYAVKEQNRLAENAKRADRCHQIERTMKIDREEIESRGITPGSRIAIRAKIPQTERTHIVVVTLTTYHDGRYHLAGFKKGWGVSSAVSPRTLLDMLVGPAEGNGIPMKEPYRPKPTRWNIPGR